MARGIANTGRHPIETIDAYAPKDRLPGRLSRQHHDLLRLDADGNNYGQIAAVMNIPVGTVKSGLSRAKAALEKLIAGVTAKAEEFAS